MGSPFTISLRSENVFLASLGTASVGIAAKALGLINQIASVSLITSSLGADGLQGQFLAISTVGWFHLTLFGMHTSLPLLLIQSRDNDELFRSTAISAFCLASIGGLISFVLTLILLGLGWIGEPGSAPLIAAASCNAAITMFSLSERVFQAIDRITLFNVLSMSGTMASLFTTLILARIHGTTAAFVAAYYLGMLFPSVVAALIIIPQMTNALNLSLHNIGAHANKLAHFGVFGLGWEISAYCKLQAPLVLLSSLGLASEIAAIGLGLRLIALASSGLTVFVPIVFLRIGEAIAMGDQRARRLWTWLGIAGAGATAVLAAGIFLIFGKPIYRLWTAEIISLGQLDKVALASFSAVVLGQFLLFPLVAADPLVSNRLRWLFWIEGPAVLMAGAAGAVGVPAAQGAAGMLAGAAFIILATTAILLRYAAGKDRR